MKRNNNREDKQEERKKFVRTARTSKNRLPVTLKLTIKDGTCDGIIDLDGNDVVLIVGDCDVEGFSETTVLGLLVIDGREEGRSVGNLDWEGTPLGETDGYPD